MDGAAGALISKEVDVKDRTMKTRILALGLSAIAMGAPCWLLAADYSVSGKAGLMTLVSVSPEQAENEDVYRLAVADACAGKPVCQVHYWVGQAPSGLPLTDEQVETKRAVWQLNMNTGLRRWLVKCEESNLFADNRECM